MLVYAQEASVDVSEDIHVGNLRVIVSSAEPGLPALERDSRDYPLMIQTIAVY